jgi:pimeloyl-ACP methyl ester carboxylesterase
MQHDAWEGGAEEAQVLEPPVTRRLQEIRCPTLILVGEYDIPDMHAIAAHVAATVDGARLETIPGAAHLPSLERPDEVGPRLRAFLAE